jgi:predicted dehydrogenase
MIRHLPALLSHPNVEVVAFVDINEQKVKDIAIRYKKNYYTSLSEMLEKEDVDFIDIATPINTHETLAIEALRQEKHVIMEKPMATSVQECEQIVDLCKRKNLKVTIYHTMKVYPIVAIVKRWIEDGKIGKPYFTSFLTSYGELQP